MITQHGDRVQVSGALTMASVAALHGALPKTAGALVVDFSAVDAVDSAGVGLLLAWLRQAQQQGTVLRYENMPANLLSLARLYDVADLLPHP